MNTVLSIFAYNIMASIKFITTSILIFFLSLICNSQTADTIRIYDQLKLTDRWKLKIKNNKSFTLHTNNLFTKDDITLTGLCKISDSTIQFLCDTSKLKNKNLAKDRLKQLSNIPYILLGETFARQSNFFIPRNIVYESDTSISIPKGIFARYYRGDGHGSSIIELKDDNTYIIYDNSCMARFTEEGKWALKGTVISFFPTNKEWSMLEWFTKGRKLYITENYLIGKKTIKSYAKTKKVVVTETYSFLSKLPEYLSD